MERPGLESGAGCEPDEEPGQAYSVVSDEVVLVDMSSLMSMHAMLRKGSSSDMSFEMSFPRCAIWVCMYIRKVRDDHRPIFMIVVSLCPCIFRAMAPPARRE